MHHLGEMSPSQVKLWRSKVISGARVGKNDLTEMTVRNERSDSLPHYPISEKKGQFLISHFRARATALSGCSTSLHGLTVDLAKGSNQLFIRATGDIILARGSYRHDSLLAHLAEIAAILLIKRVKFNDSEMTLENYSFVISVRFQA